MGFIEDLRRKRAIEEERRREQILLEQEQKQIEAQLQLVIALEKQRLKGLAEEAKKRFQESGLGEIIAEAARLGGCHFPSFYNDEQRGIYSCSINISRKTTPYENYNKPGFIETRDIEIETDVQGTIRFKGNIFGSSTVRQSIWQENRNALEKALGKACKNPWFSRYRNSPPPPLER